MGDADGDPRAPLSRASCRRRSPFLLGSIDVRTRLRPAADVDDVLGSGPFLVPGAFRACTGFDGWADPAREAGPGVLACGVDVGPSEDWRRFEDCVGTVPEMLLLFRRRRLEASALDSLVGRVDAGLR